jgi:hypothetical protein
MTLRLCVVTSLAVAIFGAPIAATSGQSPTVTPVAPTALQKLLPSADGWTSTPIRANQIVMSPEATYTFANVTMMKDEWRVKVQVSDTGGSSDSLTALAMVVICPPSDYTAESPEQTIKRKQIDGAPAAEMWNGNKNSGEITAVVAGRFVVTVDSSNVDSLQTLREIFAKIDLKAVAALK